MSLAAAGAVAGTLATLIFVASAFPMLRKAYRTRNLSSYSQANLMLANAGNLLQTVYVISIPVGPLWAMHFFNVIASGLMLLWWLRYHWGPQRRLTRAAPAAAAAHTQQAATHELVVAGSVSTS